MAHPHSPPSALDAVAPRLCCPACDDALHRDGRSLVCAAGHTFDVARQGYVNLIGGRRRHPGDDSRMVAARERFLAAGHFRPVSRVLAELAAEHTRSVDGVVVDLAGGTGHHLSAVLDACPRRFGVCIDASAPALRRAARAHPRAAAVGADVWDRLPLRAATACAVLSVFGPRGVAEVERVLAPGGVVLVGGPCPEHLQELGRIVGGVGIDPRRPQRLAASLRRFERVAHRVVSRRVALRHEEAHAAVAMGPSARHLSEDQLARAIARLPESVEVTVSVEVSVHRRVTGGTR